MDHVFIYSCLCRVLFRMEDNMKEAKVYAAHNEANIYRTLGEIRLSDLKVLGGGCSEVTVLTTNPGHLPFAP